MEFILNFLILNCKKIYPKTYLRFCADLQKYKINIEIMPIKVELYHKMKYNYMVMFFGGCGYEKPSFQSADIVCDDIKPC